MTQKRENKMKQVKVFTLCALTTVLAACGSSDSTENTPGSVSISGVASEGQVLTATVNDADGVEEANITYAWVRSGSAIAGATSKTFTLTVNEAGAEVYAAVVYTDNNGTVEAHTSSPTAPIEALPVDDPGTVTISGATTVNQELSAVVTDGNLISGTISYQWFADGVAITGATNANFTLSTAELRAVITVTASYTDDDGFAAQLSSAPSNPVTSDQVNTPAELTIPNSSTLVAGDVINANLLDPNGTTNAVFVWSADDVVLAGVTSDTYTPTPEDIGKILSVSVSFTDDDGNPESVSATAEGIVHFAVTDSLASLQAAITAATDGAIIGLDTGSYLSADDLANQMVIAANDVQLILVDQSTAVLSGNLCIHVTGNNVVIDGLTFSGFNLLSGSECEGNGPSFLYLEGSNGVVQNNTFTGEAPNSNSNFSWIAVKGFQNLITRNSFSDDSNQTVFSTGGPITIYASATEGNSEAHTISYNLFKDFGPGGDDGNRASGAFMLQVGRTTGAEGAEDGLNVIEFNLFQNVNMDRRYMRVQSGNNTFRNNTFIDGSGMISMEDGQQNTVTNNIFINTIGDNSDDGAIAYNPFGHVITNNYIAGMRTTSGDRAGLYAITDANVLNGAGNLLIFQPGQSNEKVVVANNTLINNREAIEFRGSRCDPVIQFNVDFIDNLVANGEEDGPTSGNATNGNSREAIQDDCPIDPASRFVGNHIYSETITNSGTDFVESFAGSMNNLLGPDGAADLVAGNDGLLEGQGVDAAKGADTSALRLLTEADVGPNSAPMVE